MTEKQSKNSKGGARIGAGRPKGALDKGNATLRQMILNALDTAGGESYLALQAQENPNAFLSLIGKVLPTTLASDETSPLKMIVSWKKS